MALAGRARRRSRSAGSLSKSHSELRVASVVAIAPNSKLSLNMTQNRIELWLFEVTDPLTGKRRRTTYWMTMQEAREHYLDPVPVPDSLEIREVDDDTQRLRIE